MGLGFDAFLESTQDKIDAILAWAENFPDFDTSFIESLDRQYRDRGTLSRSQLDALDNIIEKWNIKV